MYSNSGSLFLRRIAFLKILVTEMSSHHAKRSRTVKEWHSRAMLVDPKKTRIMIVTNDKEAFENRYYTDATFVTGIAGNNDSGEDKSAENLAMISEIFGTEVSFVPVDN